MTTNEKYPPVVLADDYLEKLQQVPLQAWWADEDEPMLPIPTHGFLPYRVAVKYGLVRPDEIAGM